MLRVSAGNYTDTFCRVSYRVWRDRQVLATHTETGWRFQVKGGLYSPFYETKTLAAQAARREIDRAVKI